MVQLELPAIEVPQVSVSEKLPAFVPPTTMLFTAIAAVLAFVTVTGSELVSPTVTSP
jgi:hypothetical protein